MSKKIEQAAVNNSGHVTEQAEEMIVRVIDDLSKTPLFVGKLSDARQFVASTEVDDVTFQSVAARHVPVHEQERFYAAAALKTMNEDSLDWIELAPGRILLANPDGAWIANYGGSDCEPLLLEWVGECWMQDEVGHGGDCAKQMHAMAECTCGFNETDDPDDLAPQMHEAATMMHALAEKMADTSVPFDVIKRLHDVADDMEQLAGESLDKAEVTPDAAVTYYIARTLKGDVPDMGYWSRCNRTTYAANMRDAWPVMSVAPGSVIITNGKEAAPVVAPVAPVRIVLDITGGEECALWTMSSGASHRSASANAAEDAHVVGHFFNELAKGK